MELDIEALLRLPAADRLALADLLRRSVGHPRDVELLDLPAWQRAHLDTLLRRWCGRPEGASPQDPGPQKKEAPPKWGFRAGT